MLKDSKRIIASKSIYISLHNTYYLHITANTVSLFLRFTYTQLHKYIYNSYIIICINVKTHLML